VVKLYLDTCSLHRPLDNKADLRVALESEAVLALLALCESGQATLVSSDVLVFEVERNPNPQRKAFVSEILAAAVAVVALDDQIELRAKELEGRGVKALDALHLASAEAGGVNYFCTCDDRFLKKAKALADLGVAARSPLELVQEIAT
jgi:predicted nucleic acid-binding protein